MQGRADENGKERFLVISVHQQPEVTALIDEFKRMLGLDPAKRSTGSALPRETNSGLMTLSMLPTRRALHTTG
jgi:hypothetical protein